MINTASNSFGGNSSTTAKTYACSWGEEDEAVAWLKANVPHVYKWLLEDFPFNVAVSLVVEEMKLCTTLGEAEKTIRAFQMSLYKDILKTRGRDYLLVVMGWQKDQVDRLENIVRRGEE